MPRRALTIVIWTVLALATLILVATDPSPRTFALVTLSWTGGIISYRLTAGPRTDRG